MKTLRFLLVLILTSVLFSCTGDSGWDLFGDKPSRRRLNENGFAIYTTKNFMPYNQSIDYTTFNLDTVDLNDKPFLTGEDIISYDSLSHILTLHKNRTELTYPRQSVYGQMFIVFLYDKPVYCGFFWYAFSSVPCNWIYIRDFNDNDELKSNQIQFSAGYPNPSFFHGSDPRSSKVIIDYFESAGKLI